MIAIFIRRLCKFTRVRAFRGSSKVEIVSTVGLSSIGALYISFFKDTHTVERNISAGYSRYCNFYCAVGCREYRFRNQHPRCVLIFAIGTDSAPGCLVLTRKCIVALDCKTTDAGVRSLARCKYTECIGMFGVKTFKYKGSVIHIISVKKHIVFGSSGYSQVAQKF